MTRTENGSVPVITISREYGAGGRTLAKALSRKLDIPWYDKDFVKITAQKSGYSENEINEEGEEISAISRTLNSILNSAAPYTSSHDAIFEAQKKAMLDLAQKPCILVGRCGNVILREAKVDSFDIFLYASPEIRAERALKIDPGLREEPRKYVEKRDAYRRNYYKAYAKSQMGQAQNYNICVDTGRIDCEILSDYLADFLLNRQ